MRLSRAKLRQIGESYVCVNANTLNVHQVLTTGYWPAYPAMEVAMPEEMKEHVECFRCVDALGDLIDVVALLACFLCAGCLSRLFPE